jgi:metallo-beta-lactamase superfamily protein
MVKKGVKATRAGAGRAAATPAKSGRTRSKAGGMREAASLAKQDIYVRMYRHGLGDCFLVRLPSPSSGGSFNVMIDCGVIGKKSFQEQDVVNDILQTTNSRIDLLVVTHEHEDHVSGFRVAKDQLAGNVERVWMGWTEDPDDPLATRLRKEREARKATLHMLMDRLATENRELASGVAGILDFFALDAKADLKKNKTREGLENARSLVARDDLRYCRPADAPVSFKEAPDFRFYVLGPPQDEGLIRKTDDKSERYPRLALSGQLNLEAFAAVATGDLTAATGMDGLDETAPGPDRYCPFDASYRLLIPAVERGALGAERLDPARSRPGASALDRFFDLHYFGNAPVYDGQGGGEQNWRRIDGDWLSAASDFALQLDRLTNNTSLALAIEHVPTQRVLLFAADAQVGNWLSWQDLSWTIDKDNKVTGPDLLKRTVFYKVGHHGSENATPSKKGLEQMVSDKLVAFIPVFESTAISRNWNFMPLKRILTELDKRTRGRTVRSDEPFAPISNFALTAAPNGLFYEYALPT